jgi:hypothetical protein
MNGGTGSRMNFARRLWQRGRNLLPIPGFYFDRPLVLLQSDDWGRVGLRDRDGFDELRAAGILLGERPYDFYSLETAEDVSAITDVLKKHKDSSGRCPCVQMSFILANLDFVRMRQADDHRLYFLPLSDGFPAGWKRPNLIEAYRAGIADGLFQAALHGSSHFCVSAVERSLGAGGERGKLLRSLWQAATPYIHWRMPWIGYEYWDPEQPENERFLPAEKQEQLIGETVGYFAKLFGTLPHSACAPAYRANFDTHRAWARHGIRVAQNGPGTLLPPHFDGCGLLNLSRTVEFEPAVDATFSVEKSLSQAEAAFRLGLPAIISVHSINFHSSVRDFRGFTLHSLDEFLTALEQRYSDLLYLHDEDLRNLVNNGCYTSPRGDALKAHIRRKNFTRARLRGHTETNGES